MAAVQASYSGPQDLEPLVAMFEEGAAAATELAAKHPEQPHHKKNATRCREHAEQVRWLVGQQPDPLTAVQALACLIAGNDIPGAPAGSAPATTGTPAELDELRQLLVALHKKVDSLLSGKGSARSAARAKSTPAGEASVQETASAQTADENVAYALRLVRHYGIENLPREYLDGLASDIWIALVDATMADPELYVGPNATDRYRYGKVGEGYKLTERDLRVINRRPSQATTKKKGKK